MSDMIGDYMKDLARRLDNGRRQYGQQSFTKPVAKTVAEILEEGLDECGWSFILWAQAARKTDNTRDPVRLQAEFLENVERRIRANDRSYPKTWPPNHPWSIMAAIEILAIDLFLHREELRRRLEPMARAIEVAQSMGIDRRSPYQSRRGGIRDPRSDD